MFIQENAFENVAWKIVAILCSLSVLSNWCSYFIHSLYAYFNQHAI